MRVGARAVARARDADALHQLDRAVERRRLADVALVNEDLLGDLLADPVDRVERAHRVLEDHRYARAADPPQLVVARADQLGALEVRVALEEGVRRARQAHQRHRGDRLAGAGLADDRHDLAGVDRERHAVDGAHEPLLGAEAHAEILH